MTRILLIAALAMGGCGGVDEGESLTPEERICEKIEICPNIIATREYWACVESIRPPPGEEACAECVASLTCAGLEEMFINGRNLCEGWCRP